MTSSFATVPRNCGLQWYRDQLHQLYLGRPHGTKTNMSLTSELPCTILALSLDPANVTLEAEYFTDTDHADPRRATVAEKGVVSQNAYILVNVLPTGSAGASLPAMGSR